MSDKSKAILQSGSAGGILRKLVALPSTVVLRTNLSEIVEKTKLTEKQFCKVFGIPDRKWENWKKGKEKPDAAVCILLHLIANDREGVFIEVTRFKNENPGVLESLQ